MDTSEEFLPYSLIELVSLKHTGFVIVVMGADNPYELEKTEVLEFAKEKAESKIKSDCEFINTSDILVNGQNVLPLRVYTFRKYQDLY